MAHVGTRPLIPRGRGPGRSRRATAQSIVVRAPSVLSSPRVCPVDARGRSPCPSLALVPAPCASRRTEAWEGRAAPSRVTRRACFCAVLRRRARPLWPAAVALLTAAAALAAARTQGPPAFATVSGP